MIRSLNNNNMETSSNKRRHHHKNECAFEDRLSSLPDPILANILSFLPILSAAATSVLSRRWRHNLWTQLPRLRFHNVSVPTASHILSHLTSPEIHSFRLKADSTSEPGQLIPRLQSWVRQFCTPNLDEILVDISNRRNNNNGKATILMELPSCLITCRSLVVVKLGLECNINSADYGKIDLPNLKRLRVHVYDSNRESMGVLIKSCPLLADLKLIVFCTKYGKRHVVDVSSGNLRRLGIDIRERSKYGQAIIINAPKIEKFTVSGIDLLSIRYMFGKNKGENEISKGYEFFYSYLENGYVGGLSRVEGLLFTHNFEPTKEQKFKEELSPKVRSFFWP